MATSKSFPPEADNALLAASLNFSTQITLTPVAFGLSAAQATAFAALYQTFATAMQGVEPGVRSKASVFSKNSAKRFLTLSARQLAKIVEATPTVTNAQRATLGLNVRAMPTPSPVPATAPNLNVGSVSGFVAQIRLHDSASGSKRGKPPSVSGASVFSFIGLTPPTEMSGWTFEGNTGRTRLNITFPGTLTPGSKVWFTAFWFNGAKQNGPMCAPVGTNMPGGAVGMAA